jgi:hypothetical protein
MTFQNPNEPPFSEMDYDFNRPTNVEQGGDYRDSKTGLGEIYNPGVIATPWEDSEPLITPDKIKRLHLWGIPLVSNVRDPLTNRPQIIGDPELKEFINEAVGLAELEGKFEIFPRQRVEKAAFDRAAYDSFGYMQLRHRPVSSLESMTVTPSNEMNVFQIPNEWIDTGLLAFGQLALIPLTIAVKTGTMVPLTSSPGGAMFLSIFGNKPWIPCFWEIRYTTGFKNGTIPKTVNQLVGVIAAMEVLSVLATTYSRSNSTSLGIDGLSQSISTPGMEIYKQRMEELGAKRHWLTSRLQARFNVSYIMDNV